MSVIADLIGKRRKRSENKKLGWAVAKTPEIKNGLVERKSRGTECAINWLSNQLPGCKSSDNPFLCCTQNGTEIVKLQIYGHRRTFQISLFNVDWNNNQYGCIIKSVVRRRPDNCWQQHEKPNQFGFLISCFTTSQAYFVYQLDLTFLHALKGWTVCVKSKFPVMENWAIGKTANFGSNISGLRSFWHSRAF